MTTPYQVAPGYGMGSGPPMCASPEYYQGMLVAQVAPSGFGAPHTMMPPGTPGATHAYFLDPPVHPVDAGLEFLRQQRPPWEAAQRQAQYQQPAPASYQQPAAGYTSSQLYAPAQPYNPSSSAPTLRRFPEREDYPAQPGPQPSSQPDPEPACRCRQCAGKHPARSVLEGVVVLALSIIGYIFASHLSKYYPAVRSYLYPHVQLYLDIAHFMVICCPVVAVIAIVHIMRKLP